MNRKIRKEITKEQLIELENRLFNLQAILETASIALFHVQDEPEPVSKAVTMSYAVQHAAELCAEYVEAVRDWEVSPVQSNGV